MKIFTIVGARPNFIKIDPDLQQTIVHTGQHYDFEMSKSFFEELDLPEPAYNLGKTKVGEMIDALIDLFKQEKPELVLVFGDTNSSLAGALAASYCNIKIAHVEAGLRSHRLDMPEEVNRVLIDRIATIKLCPNQDAEFNLQKEGIRENVYVVGDPMLDTFFTLLPIEKNEERYQKYMLITLHRNFNADDPAKLRSFFEALEQSDKQFKFPMHPRTKNSIAVHDIKVPANVEILPPQSYPEMIKLISDASKVITDSGGVQREAYWMNVPVIICREETEWTEIIKEKGGILVGTDKEKLLDAINNFTCVLHGAPQPGANKRIKNIIYKHI